MQEKSPIPRPKLRLVFSIIMVLIGIFILTGAEPFEYYITVGWITVGVGVLSALYNINCMKNNTFM